MVAVADCHNAAFSGDFDSVRAKFLFIAFYIRVVLTRKNIKNMQKRLSRSPEKNCIGSA